MKLGFNRDEWNRPPEWIWDKRMHQFVLFGLLVGLAATGIRWGLLLFGGTGDIVERVGGPIALAVHAYLAVLLWRRPDSIRFVTKAVYLFMTVGLGLRLAYILYFGDAATVTQFAKLTPWMAVNYLLPFLIFSSRTATFLSAGALSAWVVITAGYVVGYHGTDQARAVQEILFQVYPSHLIVILFMQFYAHLKAQYLSSQRSVRQLHRISNTDYLLGTANRRSAQLGLRHEIGRAAKTGSPLSVILMDMDHFKAVNDTYGHGAGDAVLIAVARLLGARLHPPHVLARWGGEEFLVILPNTTEADAYQLAEQLRSAVNTHPFAIGSVTASFGVAAYRTGDTRESLVRRADMALYAAKGQGRDRVEVIS